MPEGPPQQPPNQPPNQQPFDPIMVEAFTRMMGGIEVLGKGMEKLVDLTGKMGKNMKETDRYLNKEKISDIVGYFSEMENKLSEITRFSKKFAHDVQKFKDTKTAKEEIEDMVKAMKEALASQKSFSSGAVALAKQIEAWEAAAKRFGDEIRDLAPNEMKDLTNLAERTARAGKDFANSMKSSSIGKAGDFIRGALKHGRSEKGYVGGVRDRWEGMKEVFKGPGRVRVAAAAGEGGAAAAGGGGMLKGIMEGVVDAIEGGVGALEVGMEALTGPLGWLVIAVEALIATFDKYAKQNKDIQSKIGKGGIFGGLAPGKGMLDEQGQTSLGGEDAFSQWRDALNPKGTGFNELGLSWQRNIDTAGAIAEGGYNMQGMLKGGNMGNSRSSTQGIESLTSGFAPGSFGQMQRITSGVGQNLGMGDTEGVARVLKMLEQYSQTLDSTERFLTQIDKDTQAAGISTTKYLQIFDDVGTHFSKFNKSMGQTLNLMRELGRSGAISSEVLKDMMEFLTQEAKPDIGGISDRIYAQSIIPKEYLKQNYENQKVEVSKGLDAINNEIANAEKANGGHSVGITVPDAGRIGDLLDKGDVPGAQALVNKMSLDIDNAQNAGSIQTDKAQQLRQDAIQLNKQIATAGSVNPATSTAQSRATAEAGGLRSVSGTAMMKLGSMQQAAQQWGIPLADLISGAAFAGGKNGGKGGDKSTQMIGMMSELGSILHMDPAEAIQQFSTLSTAQGEKALSNKELATVNGKANATALTKEVFTKWKGKGGIPTWAKEAGMTEKKLAEIGDNGAAQLEWATEHTANMIGEFAGTKKIEEQTLASMADQTKIEDSELALELDKSRKTHRQMQDFGDILSGIFEKWFTEIISWLEYLGKAFAWVNKATMMGVAGIATPEESKTNRKNEYATWAKTIGDDLKELPSSIEEAQKDQLILENKNKGKTLDQWSQSDQDDYAQLGDMVSTLSQTKNQLGNVQQNKTWDSDDSMHEMQQTLKDLTATLQNLHTISGHTTIISGTSVAQDHGNAHTPVDSKELNPPQGLPPVLPRAGSAHK